MITHLEPSILECEVKRPLGIITMNKTSRGDGIPVELFQILKDDVVQVLHSMCQQIWKTQQWPQDWKRSVFIPIPKKGNAKECSNYHTKMAAHSSVLARRIPGTGEPRGLPSMGSHRVGHDWSVLAAAAALISHASKVMLKVLQARLQQYLNRELPDVQAGFRKGRGTRDRIDNIHWIIEKAREFLKNIYFCFIDYANAFDYVDHNKLWKILKEMGIPDYLPCPLRNLYAG